MGENVKYIIEELNKAPYNKNFNLISFHELEQLSLLQILSDVLAEIDPRQKRDIREEAADETAVRILNQLRVLKYKPTKDDMVSFRTGLVQAERHIIYPIIEWLLRNNKDLKQRAYLGHFLVKLDVPDEFRSDEQVHDLYEQYEALMEKFKSSHKNVMTIRSSGLNTTEIRKDITNMEDEKEQLIKRVERLKRKVDSQPNAKVMMAVSRKLRLEKDRQQKLSNQRLEQKNLIQHCEQRIQRVQQHLSERRHASVGATSHSVFKRLEEELHTNEYMMNERLPNEIASFKKTFSDLQKVAMEPAMGQSDLDEINAKIININGEINELVEKKMRNNDPMDDKLSLFKQQAAIIAHKKEAAAENLKSSREEYSQLLQEYEDKKSALSNVDKSEILKGDEFKSFVNKLRGKSTTYKKARQELAELRAEMGVLSRTDEILRAKSNSLNQNLNDIESEKGVSGYRVTQEELERVSAAKGNYDELKSNTLESISDMVNKLTAKINSKRSALVPVIKELRSVREKHQDLKVVHADKKSEYERISAGIESNRSKLEQEVRGLREEVGAEESRYHSLNKNIEMMSLEKQKVEEEFKTYTSSDPADKKKTLREQYKKKIQEQENLGKALREKQKTVRENHGPNMKQMKMWKDLEKIMECKHRCLHRIENGQQAGMTSGVRYNSALTATVLKEDMLVL